MHVMGIPEVQGYERISLRYRVTKRYQKREKEGKGLSSKIISNL